MRQVSAEEIVAAVQAVQDDRDRLRHLLEQVNRCLIDRSPDGLAVVYVPAALLDDIRQAVTP